MTVSDTYIHELMKILFYCVEEEVLWSPSGIKPGSCNDMASIN